VNVYVSLKLQSIFLMSVTIFILQISYGIQYNRAKAMSCSDIQIHKCPLKHYNFESGMLPVCMPKYNTLRLPSLRN
jgi:hypothetical protein